MDDTLNKGGNLAELADHHWGQGVYHANRAYSNAPWYHDHAKDTAKAANHFTIAAALRAQAGEKS